ncbi:MAG: argininosuccinate lyase [Coriobacteriia bacterium]|nr:argininosuccinate lyase [Coriobacteriia bacterium]
MAKKKTTGPGAPESVAAQTPWGGRFEEVPDEIMQQFGASLPFDQRLCDEDIFGSLAHAAMLASQGILTEDEFQLIEDGLQSIQVDIDEGVFAWDITDEDVHMAIESALVGRIGEVGKKLHTGRSRNDQVATDLRLAVKAATEILVILIDGLCAVLEQRAAEHKDVIMPGYTHMQKAQPVLLADHLGAYVAMLQRDALRMELAYDAADMNVLGSGALAGTSHPIDRDLTTELLGFREVGENTLDGVSDRDFVLDLLYACSVCQMHLSRLSEELILWSTEEFGFVTFSDATSTGSSIMPQKKNPDFAELIRGKTGRVYGNLLALLTTMKGLPLAYNKDMQEDKEPFFDSVDTVLDSLNVMLSIMESITFHTDIMRKAAGGGFMVATDLADYLVGKGMAFRDAHEVVGKLVLKCEREGKTLQQLGAKDYAKICDLFEPDVLDWVDIEKSVARRHRDA